MRAITLEDELLAGSVLWQLRVWPDWKALPMGYAKTSERREKRLLREQMRSMGLGYRDIAAEFARRYNMRPRAAWREAYGWSLQDTADRINEFRGDTGLDPGGLAAMTAPHLSEYETWPGHRPEPSGRRPTPYLLAVLAAVYDCAVTDLIDLADRQHLRPADLLILDKYSQPAAKPARITGQDPENRNGSLSMAGTPLLATRQVPDVASRELTEITTPGRGGVTGLEDRRLAEQLRRTFLAGGLAALTLPALGLDELKHITAAITDARRYADMPQADLLILERYSQPAGHPVQLNRALAARAAAELRDQREVFLPDVAHADARLDLGDPHAPVLPSLGPGEGQEDRDPVRRRTFVGLTGVSLISTVLGEAAATSTPAETEPFAAILTGNAAGVASSEPGSPAGTSTLAADVDNARRDYQGCRYSELTRHLPGLLARLDSACETLAGDARGKACELSADAYHVAAGLLLKLDDQGLASLAADRSMRAAQASGDPVTIGASARIVTHTLMSGGHLPAAVSAASRHAAGLDHAMTSHTADSLSVYGALLLRGSVAAAQHGDRATAHELLGEADEAARRLGLDDADANLRWTAFGPANAMLHRVNIAVTLGDAGTAIDVAGRVDLSRVTVTERRATLLLDVSRAYLQWGRHEKAYAALRAAEATAHEEVAGRPSVHRLLRDLRTTAPASIRRDVDQFAAQIGVAS